ncbi:MAG: TRAP transporter TatT component family protein [Anaeromyxobacter sp.]
MSRLAPLLLVALALGACRRVSDAAPPAPAAEAARQGAERYAAALAEGDQAWSRRGDAAGLDGALAAYGRAAAQRPGAAEAELRLARAEAFRALAAQAPAAAREGWDASARAAERALRALAPGWAAAIDAGEDPAAAAARVDAPGAEALYLLAQGSMRAAQATGYAAVLAVKDAALAMMARAAELDERVDAAGPHRALGAWRAALPVAAGGGAEGSKAHFERARALAPDDLLWRVAEAETYAVLVQDAALFDRLLAEVAQADRGRDGARGPENAIARKRGEALAARKARLF